jgi:hypothetical protein
VKRFFYGRRESVNGLQGWSKRGVIVKGWSPGHDDDIAESPSQLDLLH